MNPMEITVTALVGIVASVVTAYVTYRFTVKRERRSHERNIAAKLAEIPSTLDSATRIMAIQFAEWRCYNIRRGRRHQPGICGDDTIVPHRPAI